MNKPLIFTESVITSVESKRAMQLAGECLLEIRLVESRKVDTRWWYEYEIRGESGRIAKYLERLKKVGIIEKCHMEN